MGHQVPWSRLGDLLNHLPSAREPLQIALSGGEEQLRDLIALVLRRAGHRTGSGESSLSTTPDLCLNLAFGATASVPSENGDCARELCVITAGGEGFKGRHSNAEAPRGQRQTLFIGPIIRNDADALQRWRSDMRATDVRTATWPLALHAEDLALSILRVIETPEISEWRAGLADSAAGQAFVAAANERLVGDGLPPLSAAQTEAQFPSAEPIPAQVYGPGDLGALLAHWLIRRHRWRRGGLMERGLPPVFLMGEWLRLDEREEVRAFDCAQGTLSFVRDEDLRPAFAVTAIQGALAIAESAQSDTWRALEDPARPPMSLSQLGPSRHAPLTPGAKRSLLPLRHWFERGLAAGASEAELHSWLGFGIRNGVLISSPESLQGKS